MITQNKIKHFFGLKKSTTGKELFAILGFGGLLVGIMLYSIIQYAWSLWQ